MAAEHFDERDLADLRYCIEHAPVPRETRLRLLVGVIAMHRPQFVFLAPPGAERIVSVGLAHRPRLLGLRTDSENLLELHRVVAAAGRWVLLDGSRQAVRSRMQRAIARVRRMCPPLGDALQQGLGTGGAGARIVLDGVIVRTE